MQLMDKSSAVDYTRSTVEWEHEQWTVADSESSDDNEASLASVD